MCHPSLDVELKEVGILQIRWKLIYHVNLETMLILVQFEAKVGAKT